MESFLKKLVLFSVIMMVTDIIVGVSSQMLIKSAKSGDTYRNEYIVNGMNADILIFGSSRAIHHYVPQIFEDSLGMTCYNCGSNGMGIIFSYARYKMITERYVPKIVIYDVYSWLDFLEYGDNYKYLDCLKPYYDHEGIDSLFGRIAPTERIKNISQMYRYNGKILQMVADNLVALREENKGYRPLRGMMIYEPQNDGIDTTFCDSVKMYYMERFIQECGEKGTFLIFCLSPFYRGKFPNKQYVPLMKLAHQYGVPIINYYSDEEIVNNIRLFKDPCHMNCFGATLYSRKLAPEIRELLRSQIVRPLYRADCP